MVPTSWLALLLFLLVVSPGLFFELLGSRRRPGIVESTFREIGRIVLGSLGFTIIAIVILSVVRAIAPVIMPSPHDVIVDGGRYFADHYALVLAAVVAETAIAHGLAFGLHKFLARHDGEHVRPDSAWAQVFQRDLPRAPTVVHVRIRLSGGTVVFGSVANFSPESALADRELVLAPPLYVKGLTGERQQLPTAYRRLVIRGSEIETIAVEYRPVRIPAVEEPQSTGG